MLYTTPSNSTQVNFYAMKRFRKGNFLFASLTSLPSHTLYILEGLVFDYINSANTPKDFIFPTISSEVLAHALKSINDAKSSLITLADVGFIQLGGGIARNNISNFEIREIPFRITPLYFVLFDICSCIDTTNMYIPVDALIELKEVYVDALYTDAPSLEKTIFSFQEFLLSPQCEMYIAPRSRTIIQGLLDLLPHETSNMEG